MQRKFLSILIIFFFQLVRGQHEMKDMKPDQDTTQMVMDSAATMSHAYSLNLPMTRNGSGTAWQPDASVMYANTTHQKKWMFMLHYNLFLRYDRQDIATQGKRGGEKFDAPGWIMLMGQRKVGRAGLFHFSSMFSIDPITEGKAGYPLLFQTGETYRNERLVDRQHPHDFFSGLSVAYTQMISGNIDVTAYFGYPGEPALGPVAFMHRVSALNNPDAPLGHHWQDATHITFGVATLGVRLGMFKIEGSTFKGREPDENRYDLDKPRYDSYSLRLSCNPTKRLALQISRGFIKSPEAAEPGKNVKRSTVSLIHFLPLQKDNTYLASAIVWGYNEAEQNEQSLLFESSLQLNRIAIYTRYEWVQKDAAELDLAAFINSATPVFNINAFTLGLNWVFLRTTDLNAAIGCQGTIFMADTRLDHLYSRYPVSGEIYLRFYPQLMRMRDGSAKQGRMDLHN